MPVDGGGRRIAPALRFFDAHCDTILKIVENEADFTAFGSTHVNLPGMISAGVCTQVFAACVIARHSRGREDEIAMSMVKAVETLCDAHSDRLVLGRSFSEIEAACAGSGHIALISSLEGADPLMGDPGALAAFYSAGVRLLTVAWADNDFAGTARGSGAGLSRKGEDLVSLCEDLGVVVDVSHASDQAFWDVCAATAKPFVASHSNSRALCANPRNLTDEMIRTIGERGGVVGLNLYSGFLSSEFSSAADEFERRIMRAVDSGEKTNEEAGAAISSFVAGLRRPPLSLFADHIKHAVKVGGEDCVAVGGDLDGVDSLPSEIDGVADYPKIAQLLGQVGLTEGQIEKVCWRNLERVFREVML